MANVVSIVDGATYLLDDIGHIGDLSWSTGWPYGCLEASWSMILPPNSLPRALSLNAQIEVWDGPVRVWVGYLSELAPSSDGMWEVHASGWYSAFGNLLALNALATAPTATPSVAVTSAISRAGLPVTYGGGLSSVSISSADETVSTNTVLSLLDEDTKTSGKRWAVDENYILSAAADPTTSTYVLASTVALRATADDDYVTDVYPRFVATVDVNGDPDSWGLGHVGTPSRPAGRRERGMDTTARGILAQSEAEVFARAQLDLNPARLGYTSGVELAYGELLRPGGTPARLGLVKAGQRFTGFTVADASGAVLPGLTQDITIGRTTYTDGAKVLPVQPVALAPRTFVDTLAALKAAPTFDGTAA